MTINKKNAKIRKIRTKKPFIIIYQWHDNSVNANHIRQWLKWNEISKCFYSVLRVRCDFVCNRWKWLTASVILISNVCGQWYSSTKTTKTYYSVQSQIKIEIFHFNLKFMRTLNEVSIRKQLSLLFIHNREKFNGISEWKK